MADLCPHHQAVYGRCVKSSPHLDPDQARRLRTDLARACTDRYCTKETR